MTDHGRREFHIDTGHPMGISPDSAHILEALRHRAFYSEPAPVPVVDTPIDAPNDSHAQAMFFRGLGMARPDFSVSLGIELADIERGMQA